MTGWPWISVCAPPFLSTPGTSPASAESCHSLIADELILAPSPSHSHGRNERGDRNREEHGGGAGIELLKDSHQTGPRIGPMRPALSSIPTLLSFPFICGLVLSGASKKNVLVPRFFLLFSPRCSLSK